MQLEESSHRRSTSWAAPAAWVLAWCLAVPPATAGEPATAREIPAVVEDVAVEDAVVEDAVAAEKPAAEPDGENGDGDDDPCAVEERGHWIEWMDAVVTRTVCSTARWFDNYFDTSRVSEERDATYGRLGLGAKWDETHGVDELARFRAKIHLPKMKDRVNVLIGGGRKEEMDDENAADGGTARDLFFSDQKEWLLGFGLNPQRSEGGRVDLDVGARFSDGVDPDLYVRLGLIRRWSPGEDRSVRIRLTPQWRQTRGPGLTSSVSLDETFGRNRLLRYEITTQSFERKFEGVAYNASVLLYQNLGGGRALRYGVSASGETGREVKTEDLGFLMTYRHSLYRETLFLETLGGISWRRLDPADEREPRAILGLLFELKFGQ